MNKKLLSIVFLVALFVLASPQNVLAQEIEMSQVVADNSVAIPKKTNFFKEFFKSIFKKSSSKSNVAVASYPLYRLKSEEMVSSQSEIKIDDTKGAEYLNRYNHDALKDGIQHNSKSFFSTKKLKDNSLQALIKTLSERKKLLLEMVKTNPKVLGMYALPLLTRSLMPKEVQGLYEIPKTLTGEVRVFFRDDFNNPDNARVEYQILSNNRLYDFYPIKPVNIQSGDNITISTISLENILVGDLLSINSSGSLRQSLDIQEEDMNAERIMDTGEIDENKILPTDHKVLVMMVKYTDSPADPFTAVEASNYIFQGQFQDFYKEQSYNKIQFSGDVYGWDTINHPTGGCYNPTIGWGGEIDSFIASHGINLANYEHLVVISNCANGFINGFSSIGKITTNINGNNYNLSTSWINGSGTNFLQNSLWVQGVTLSFPWTNLDFTISHEMGHALGLYHADGIDCGSISVSPHHANSDCIHKEYGDTYDIMGIGYGYAFHMNAFYKEKLGWSTSSNTTTVSTTGSYTLSKFQNGIGKKILRIKRPGTTLKPYYVEWRGGGYGFDKGLNNSLVSSNKNGLIIHNAYSDGAPPFYRSYLIDARANTNSWYTDIKGASLNSTSVFSDPRNGISIGPITNKTSTAITFNVTVNPIACVHLAPIFLYPESYGLTATPQAQFVINPSIKNDNYTGCSPSNIVTTMSLPAGFTSNTTSYTINSLSSENTSSFLTSVITVAPNVLPGTYMIGFTSSESSGLTSSVSVPIEIVNI